MLVFAGLVAALVTAVLYATAIALQALEARKVPEDYTLRPSLLTRLLRRPIWLLGTGLALIGWVAQVGALLLIPLTLVEPTLASSLVFLLAYGVWLLHEPIGRREVVSIVAVAAGIALLAWAAPDREPHHASGAGLAAAVSAMAVVAIVPYALVRFWRVPGWFIAVGAGMAYAIDGLCTKFFADDFADRVWLGIVLWGVLMGTAAAVGTLSEMSALQSRPATQVAPIVLGLTTIVPFALAPVLADETWSHDPWVRVALIVAVVLIVAGAVTLARSRTVGSVYEAEARKSLSDTGLSEAESSIASARPSGASGEAPLTSVTTTTSPASGLSDGVGEPASMRSAPDTGLPPNARAATYSPSEKDRGTR